MATGYEDWNRKVVTEMEDAGKEKTQIVRSVQAVSSDTTLYTVPANKVLYITAMYVSCWCNSSTGNTVAEIQVNPGGTNRHLLRSWATKYEATYEKPKSSQSSVSYPMPLKLEASRTVVLLASSTGYGAAGFVGWLEDA